MDKVTSFIAIFLKLLNSRVYSKLSIIIKQQCVPDTQFLKL
jgi:hypothetical protein